MSERKNGKCVVYEDRHGNTRCGVCCAALFCDDNGDMPLESWNRMIGVNLTGMMLVDQAAAHQMKAQGKVVESKIEGRCVVE